MHHRTIQINHQPDATIFQFIIRTLIYSSTCFGRSPAHHQELNGCSSSLSFYLRIVVIAVLCSWSGRLALPRTQHGTRGCYCSFWWWAGERRKHIELQINVRIINWKIVASGWRFIWIVCCTVYCGNVFRPVYSQYLPKSDKRLLFMHQALSFVITWDSALCTTIAKQVI
jgi:hypothetical protein